MPKAISKNGSSPITRTVVIIPPVAEKAIEYNKFFNVYVFSISSKEMDEIVANADMSMPARKTVDLWLAL